jgi:simple sugar transport system ATP-binding protein
MEAGSTLSLRGIGKAFSGTWVLQGVSLDLVSGTVLGIVGANGAGKSTLIKVLTGYYHHYDGSVQMDGRSIHLHNPQVARAAGIDAVYQEVDACIVPDLTVADNLLLNRLVRQPKRILLRRDSLCREAGQVAAQVGLEVDLQRRAGDLSLHEKQLLVIARALSFHVRFLIFDEPTASLGLAECDRLFETIDRLRASGIGVVYVSHRLREVESLCDDIAVLRNGRLVARFGAHPDMSQVAAEILGSPPGEELPAAPLELPMEDVPPALEVRDIRLANLVRGVSLAARRREILGITGLVGAGKSELLRAVFGAERRDAGTVLLDGSPVGIASPHDAVKHGIFLIPEERLTQGLFRDLSANQNITSAFLSSLCRLGLIRRRAEHDAVEVAAKKLDIRGERSEPVVSLSGGNQQKVVIAKWTMRQPRVLLLDEVTQGVDIGTRKEIYRLVRSLAATAAIIFVSSDIDEVVGLADRVLVMRDGQVVGQFDRTSVDRQAVIELASGAREVQAA